LPHSLGRRRVKVRVRVRVIGVRVIVGVIIVIIGVIVILLILPILLLRAPWRIIIRRHPVIGGYILLEGLVGWQSSSLDDGLLENLMGLSDIFFAD
jgi:hypothetical protein